MDPQPSVTVLTSLNETGTSVSQLSVAVTGGGGNILSHCMVVLAGTPTRVGSVSSSTDILYLPVVPTRRSSDLVHVLVMDPQPSVTVLTSLNETGTSVSQLSVAVNGGGGNILSHCMVGLAGTPTRVGAVSSSTVMVC